MVPLPSLVLASVNGPLTVTLPPVCSAVANKAPLLPTEFPTVMLCAVKAALPETTRLL